MKGEDRLIATLNNLLVDELTAINQYIVHAEMCDNWGYDRLHDVFQKRARDEMKHAEKLISRILFLESTPVVSALRGINIGTDVAIQLHNDHGAEETAIAKYNTAIQLADEVKDGATREMLEDILTEEDGHINEIEAMQDQIRQVGLAIFLGAQIRK
jgi:bacterioferritin